MPPISLIVILFFAGAVSVAYAHCPLCTAGAGLAAMGAGWLGVGEISIGIFIGAFAVAVGSWIANIWKMDFRFKKEALIIISFITTIAPLIYMFQEFIPLYVHLYGGYGSLLNRTYLINQFLLGSITGGAVVLLAPFVSGAITKKYGKMLWPYQGLSITFSALLITSVIFELWI